MMLVLLMHLKKLESGLSLRSTQLAMPLKKSGKVSQIGLRPMSLTGSLTQVRLSKKDWMMLVTGSLTQV